LHRNAARAADLTDADRTALATAVRELKERRGTYVAQSLRFTSETAPEVREVWARAVADVDASIEACERLWR
jgi:hypothetical protein